MTIRVNDFVDDLNYQKIIVDYEHVDVEELHAKLECDMVNHLNRFKYAKDNKMFYIENCDMQDIRDARELYEMIRDEQFVVWILQKDSQGYYLEEV